MLLCHCEDIQCSKMGRLASCFDVELRADAPNEFGTATVSWKHPAQKKGDSRFACRMAPAETAAQDQGLSSAARHRLCESHLWPPFAVVNPQPLFPPQWH